MPSKKVRKQRRAKAELEKAIAQYIAACQWANERGINLKGVVCEKCGLEQPYLTDPYGRVLRCRRGSLLGFPCNGGTCITHEHHRELTEGVS